MKKISILLILLLSTMLTTSCWSRREIENLGFVMGLGLSKTEENLYSIVVQVANPSAVVAETPTPKEVYTIIKSEGLTVFDAVRNLSMITKRRLYIAHVTALVLHESIAKDGLEDVVSFLVQDMETRLETDVFISKIPPEDIFDTPNDLGIIPAIGLSRIADSYGANSKIYISDFHETVEAVNNPVINYVTTVVEKISSPSEQEMPHLKLTEIAVFDDDKLKGYLNYEEGQAYNFITNNFKNGLIAYECGITGDKIVIEILESSTNITPSYKNGRISFDIELKVEGNVAERISQEGSPQQLDIMAVQDQLDQVLKDKLIGAIATAQQKYKVDYFNLSKNFSKKYPKEFKEVGKEWNEIFSSADITVNVKSSVIHSALNLNRRTI